jgi:hypothetical protein
VLSLCSPAFAAEEQAAPRDTFSLNLVGVQLVDALLHLHWRTGAAFVSCDASTDKRVTVHMDRGTLEQALDLIAEQAGCRWQRVGQYYVLSPKDWSYGGLPPVEQDTAYVFFPQTERLQAGRLLTALDARQVSRLAAGQDLTYADLSPYQQDILSDLYESLKDYLKRRGGTDPIATALREDALAPVDQVSFSVRRGTWSMEGAQAP